MLTIQDCRIPDLKLITPRSFSDPRGFVAETVNERRLAENGLPYHFCQENFSFSAKAGTVRGLHFQKKPSAQAKLIRVLRGKVFDVAVDLRPASPTFGQHVAVTLSDENLAHFFIPEGFAHGFCTLTDDVTLQYKVNTFYAPETEGGILWNDEVLGIDWPVDPSQALLSDKDIALPPFKALAPLEW